MYADDKNDDTEKKKLEMPEGLEGAIGDLIGDAISHVQEAFEDKQVEMTEFYKGELPGVTQEDLDDGRSDIVSRDVHDAVQATMPDLIRCFLGGESVLEFTPNGKDDEAAAAQATEAIRQIFERENDAFALIHGAIKDGLVRKFAVATWYHELKDKSFTEDYTLPEEDFAVFLAENDGKVEVVESKPPQEGVIEAKLKHLRREHCYRVDLVPPEEVIISRRARDIAGRHFVGRRQNLQVAELVGMGYDEELVREHISSDQSIKTGTLAGERNPDGQTAAPDANEAEEVLYVEGWIEWPHEDRMQLFKVCTIGDSHTVVACDPVDSVDMALWTPDPEPHTPVGESQAEKVADIQRLKTGTLRGVIDSLAEALVPRTEVVEGQVNMDDAMSTEIGGLVRVRQPNMVRPISTPFLGQQALPLINVIDNMREERVGAFRAADGLSAEAMQSSTKMAVAATISGSKAQKELLARIFAWQFLRPIFRGLLRLFVQHQDQAKVIRMRGEWVPVDPRAWNAEMDCEVNTALAMQPLEERMAFLGGIAEKQELILTTLGPQNPLVTLAHYGNTLRKMAELGGYKNADQFFARVDPNWAPPQQDQAPDPALLLAQAQAQALQQDQGRKDAESAHKAAIEERKASMEEQRLRMDDDFRRDQMDQQREIELAKLQAQFAYDTTAHDAEIEADIAKNRDTQQAATERQVLMAAAQPESPAGE